MNDYISELSRNTSDHISRFEQESTVDACVAYVAFEPCSDVGQFDSPGSSVIATKKLVFHL